MLLNLKVPFRIGPITASIFGGPFRKFDSGVRRLKGVKMAEEIDHPHHVSIPTEDFSIPDTKDMECGVISALKHVLEGNDLYVGCMGGIGRTGLFMGVLGKVLHDYRIDHPDEEITWVDDPVVWVRTHYKSHAIETEEQQHFVRNFNTENIIDWIESNWPISAAVLANRASVAHEQEQEAPVEKTYDPFGVRFFWSWFFGGK